MELMKIHKHNVISTWFLLAKKITVTQQLLTNIIGLPEIHMHGNKNNNNRNGLFALHINTRTIKEEIQLK